MNSDQLAIILWNYHHVGHRPEKADVIFALGSHDLDVARYATQLYLNGWSPLLAFSGGVAHQGDELNTGWNKPEAEMFADIAMGMGVPKEKILIENKASNTGENFTRMEEVFKERDINPQTVLLVQKPYMERRTIATGRMRWPDRNLTVTSAPISFEAYTSGGINKEKIINIMVGDLQRIKVYGEKGFQMHQDIPANVWAAYEELVSRGYSAHLLKSWI